MKRKVPLMLIVIMLLQIALPMLTVIWESDFTIESIAADEVSSGDWSYTINEDGTTIAITEYTGTASQLTIPSTIDEYLVTSIKTFAFFGCNSIENIIIPASITKIEISSFLDCRSLVSISTAEDNQYYSSIDGILFNKDKTEIICYPEAKKENTYIIPNSVTSIGAYAFSYCSALEEIIIPNNLTSIGGAAFSYCRALEEIIISNNLTSIGAEAFSYCSNLTSIEIPNSVTSIGNGAFYNCSSLTSINVEEGNQNYSSIDGILFNKDKTKIIKYPEGKKETEYIIPNSVTDIGKNAFYECTLKNITISDTVSRIEEYSFYNCQLENIIIPESVSHIGESAFSWCKNLKNIEISNNIQNIEKNAFYNSKCTIVVENFDNIETVELPNIIKRAMAEEDILYANEEFTIINCSLSDDKNQLILNEGIVTATLEVTGGALKGLSIEIKPEKYYINTAQDLWDFAAEVNNGNTFEGITVELTANIDLGCSQDNQWITIGGNLGADDSEPCFAGTFDGQEYKISGLLINNDKNCQGLFGSNKGTLKNIICEGSITNTFSNSNRSNPIGGLVAYNDNGTIYNCQTYIDVVADSFWVGGIVGNSAGGTIEKCTNFGDINSTSVENKFAGYAVGGIIGIANNTTVKECSNNGKITGSATAVGGIIGDANYGITIAKCYNNGIIEGGGYVGGIAGKSNCSTVVMQENLIYNCYNTNAVKGKNTVGGIVGFNSSKIERCYNKGTIEGDSYIGGIAGENRYFDDEINGHIENCYNIGAIIWNQKRYSGEIVGDNNYGCAIKNCYYKNPSEIKAINGADDEANNVHGLTDEYMKSAEFVNLLNTGNEETVWKMGDSTYPYPVLKKDKGDANADNVIDFMDILAINKHRLGKAQLTGECLTAADVNEDGNIDFMDILQINKYRLGKIDSL